ncbi:MAG: hypothetical protein GXY77_12315 [Fibrobacter sp.]|nr:hypothetical protein [Fibrobacter sp.]
MHTQQLCSAIYDVGDTRKVVNEKTLREALLCLFAQESKCYKAHLSKLTGIQFKCLIAIAKQGGKNTTSREFIRASGITHPATIRKALQRLEQLKILFLQNGEYRFVNSFFGKWLVHSGY